MTSKQLRDARKSLGLTQQQAAALCGCHHTHWSHIEAGRRRPGLELYGKIRQHLGVDLLGEEATNA